MNGEINLINAIPLHYRILAIGALAAATYGLGWLQGAHREQLKAAKFEAATEALGKAQVERNKETEARNLQLKEQTDAETKRTLTILRADVKRMRDARAGGSYVPSAASTAADPSRACFDRAQLESAVRLLDSEVSGIVEQGSEAVTKLDIVKGWAARASDTITPHK